MVVAALSCADVRPGLPGGSGRRPRPGAALARGANAIRRDIGIARSAFDDSWLGTWLGGVMQSKCEPA